ncbi:hypothetical protein [Polyangium spumosum]|uniref:Tetratricopeptide repeat protein n=1 Tax=Polyangium spumosum TaxID=889282 RepID=A0A6N7PP98_9BACT|nr:hypothetical protein [Polyangium spumosum]MRG93992.1 hypothetical protein [Polyangium spumosum]
MNELGPEARAILDAGRDGDDPSPADRARLRRALSAALVASGATITLGERAAEATTSLGEAASTTTKLASAAKAGAAVTLGGVAWKGMLALIVVGAASAGALLRPVATHVETPPAAPRIEAPAAPGKTIPAEAPALAEEPEVAPTSEPPPEPAPAPRPAPTLNAQATRPAPTVTTQATNEAPPEPAPADTLLAETRRLREAHGAMQNGDPAQALRLLDEAKAGAEGQSLREERAAARVLALCKLGRTAEARAEATKFLAESPASPLADRVRRACPPSP